MKRYIFLVAIAVCLLSCTGNSGAGNGIDLLDAAAFRTEIAGKPVMLYTLQNENGMTVQLTNYGARIVALWVPSADGTHKATMPTERSRTWSGDSRTSTDT